LREAPESEQPLTRIERNGPAALSLAELLQIALDSKADPLLPFRLLERWPTLSELAHASPFDLLQVEGLTRLRLARLRAALELGKRMQIEIPPERQQIRGAADIAHLLLPEMSGLPREQMRVVLLNTKNYVLGTPLVYQGSLHTTVIRIGELFTDAVRVNCAAIALVHNHPSGEPFPSPEDIAVTQEAVKAAKILDIDLIDHLVIANGRWASLKERGLI
jgi:DNA repair protein RadC